MNICIVGNGAIAKVHAQAVIKTEGVNICGICDVDKSRADSGASLFIASSVQHDIMIMPMLLPIRILTAYIYVRRIICIMK